MTDRKTDAFNTMYEPDFKKGLVPDAPVAPPINVPKQETPTSSAGGSSSTNNTNSDGASKK